MIYKSAICMTSLNINIGTWPTNERLWLPCLAVEVSSREHSTWLWAIHPVERVSHLLGHSHPRSHWQFSHLYACLHRCHCHWQIQKECVMIYSILHVPWITFTNTFIFLSSEVESFSFFFFFFFLGLFEMEFNIGVMMIDPSGQGVRWTTLSFTGGSCV